MGVDIKILGWSSVGLRCPDYKVSFEKGTNSVHKIALVQMPNGAGKTTTLKLLRAALGGPKVWNIERFDHPLQLRKNAKTLSGKFELALLYDANKRLTIILNFDFTGEGKVDYTTVFGKGNHPGFQVPTTLSAILKPDFIQLLMFDGELASNLLDSEHTNAQSAIEEMYQLSFLNRMSDRIDDYWNTLAINAGSKGSQREFTQRKNKVTNLKDHIEKVTKNKEADYAKLDEVRKTLHQLENQFQQEIKKNSEDDEAIRSAEQALNLAIKYVTDKTKETATLMKNPAELSSVYAGSIVALKDSLDKVKLPGIAAREFFEEIADEAHCICGRDIDKETKKIIRAGAKKYLGSEQVAVLNAMKSDIKDRIVNNDVTNNGAALTGLISEIEKAQHTEFMARQKLDAIRQTASNNDPLIKEIHDKIIQLKGDEAKITGKVEKYEDKTDESDNSLNLEILTRKLADAEQDLAEATDTIAQKEKRDILCRILSRAFENARETLSEEVCLEANKKIKQLMPYNNIQIASIDKCLKLAEKEGGSVGETLTVGYAFLSSLLSNATHNLPSVVDSPSGPIDLGVRPEIARLIPKLGDQFIAFAISSEREGFVKPLMQAASEDVYFLTLFRKGNAELEASAKAVKGFQQSDDGMWVAGQTYFENFHTDKQE